MVTVTAERLDNRSVPCATGLIQAAEVMDRLPAGAVLEIWTRDRFGPTEIGLWAERDGYTVLDISRAGVWPFRFHRIRVQKGTAYP